MSTTNEKLSRALDGLTNVDYPHLFSFAEKARRPGTGASKCRGEFNSTQRQPGSLIGIERLTISSMLARTDIFAFRSGHPFLPLRNKSTPDVLTALTAHSSLPSDTTSVLFIVEDIDLELIHDLRVIIGQSNTSFARFLDDVLNDMPSYNFDDNLARHLPQFRSNKKRHGHLSFHYYHFREFERMVEVSYQEVQRAAEGASWRRMQSYGAMHPCQRLRYDEVGKLVQTQFPPLFIGRNHCGVWFDADMDSQWKTGKHGLANIGLKLTVATYTASDRT